VHFTSASLCFALSLKHFAFGEVQHEAVGTPYTVAPEVIRGSYDERCDGESVMKCSVPLSDQK
jgi:hypothetical protein